MHILVSLVLMFARPAADGVPRGPTEAQALSTTTQRHHEVLRIDRDFGMDHWEIALDGWMPREAKEHITDVRLWWVNTKDADRRKPFSASLRRVIDFGYQREGGSALAVRMAGDDKEYRFKVELDASGTPAVFADVKLADGTTAEHCRCDHGRLIARRILGIPVGIAALSVRCIDRDAHAREGTVPFREVETGRAYEAE